MVITMVCGSKSEGSPLTQMLTVLFVGARHKRQSQEIKIENESKKIHRLKDRKNLKLKEETTSHCFTSFVVCVFPADNNLQK